MLYAVSEFVVKSSPLVRQILKKGDAYESEFYVEKIERKGMYLDVTEGRSQYTLFNLEKYQGSDMEIERMRDLYRAALWKGQERPNQRNKYMEKCEEATPSQERENTLNISKDFTAYNDIDEDDNHVKLQKQWILEQTEMNKDEEYILDIEERKEINPPLIEMFMRSKNLFRREINFTQMDESAILEDNKKHCASEDNSIEFNEDLECYPMIKK